MVHMKAVYEQAGAMFEVLYDPSHDSTGPFIGSVRVLDPLHKPVGPNLAPLFDKLAVVEGDEASMLLGEIAEYVEKPAESGSAPTGVSTH